MEGNNQSAKREMYKSIEEAANLTFVAEVNEKLRLNARLKDVRQADDKEGNDGEFLNGDFHNLLFNSIKC